ncbi:hypothetical protein BLA18628_07189 [Burkholderia aenigmatica]|uniref:hypothetical protein n=1 Tax=Burkholderia aenigmatica TaxID=2015348 RepID=UPI001453742E|nr:hypothetical protein [Burkholderia aenigmatica]VWD60822.1 hypothetical protein BLA18628_07189 [Burkholderia aenigmatica]
MNDHDKREFMDELNLAFQAARQPLPSPQVLRLFWDRLTPYPLPMVLNAIGRHIDASEFAPTPASILKHLPKMSDGRPEADEAWALAIRSADERETVVWTQEIAEAWAIAAPVFDGDEIGARMAFKAAYARIVEQRRAAGAPVQWIKSLGHDPDLRETVLTEAVRAGRLQLADVRSVVPQLAAPEERFDPNVAEAGIARLRALVGGIPSAREKLARIRSAHCEFDAQATADAKQRTAARVAEYEARA